VTVEVIASPTLLVVSDLESDGLRHVRALRAAGIEDVQRTGPIGLLGTYLEVRPDLVVLDLLSDPTEPAAILRQLAPIGFRSAPVPFLIVVDTAAAADAALDAGATDVIHRVETHGPTLISRVGNGLEARRLALEVSDQRRIMVAAIMETRRG
jgi:PleD family two-component response regulator